MLQDSLHFFRSNLIIFSLLPGLSLQKKGVSSSKRYLVLQGRITRSSHYDDISISSAVSVVLDMLLKFGLLQYNDGKTWELAADINSRRLYSFGDRKSNENCTAFVSTLSHRPLTFEESSMQAEIFLDSFKNVMFLPGDWHTGMNMLQSIYKVFWTDILSPMKSFLGWKRISKDVRGCYFQAARLVRYLHNVLSTYLLRCFVSSTYDEITERMTNNAHADVLCWIGSSQ